MRAEITKYERDLNMKAASKNKQKQIKVDYNCIVFIFCFFYKSSFVEKKN